LRPSCNAMPRGHYRGAQCAATVAVACSRRCAQRTTDNMARGVHDTLRTEDRAHQALHCEYNAEAPQIRQAPRNTRRVELQLEAQLLWSEGVACSMMHFVACCGWPVALPDTRRFRLILCDSGDLCFGFACRTNVHLCAGVCAAPGSTAWELALDQPEPSVRGHSHRATLPPLHQDCAPPLPHLLRDCALPLPHLHQDCALPLPHLHRDSASACHICTGTGMPSKVLRRTSNATSTFGHYLNSTLMVARS
jgi:hypothetical protein